MIAIEVEHSKVDRIDDLMKNAGYILKHKLGNGCDGSIECNNRAQDQIYALSSFLEKNNKES